MKIKIYMKNVKSKIENLNTLPPIVINKILEKCSFTRTGFGIQPKPIYMINIKNGITYTGLLVYIISILKKYNIDYEIVDMRVKPNKEYDWKINNGFTMRDYQERIVSKFVDSSRMTVFGCTSCGKAVTLDTPILTPNGFVMMEDIHIGDIVLDENGKATKVIGEYPQGMKNVYEVTFEDGSTVQCCDEHLWKYRKINSNKWEVNSLKYMMNLNEELVIPTCKPCEFNDRFESISDRFQLVYNIFHTHGIIKDGNIVCTFNNINSCEDFQLLVNSLGYRSTISNNQITVYTKDYLVNNTLKIVSIKNLNIKKEMKCIAVDSDEHTYICGNFIVTHNTFIMANMCVQVGCKTLLIAPKASLSIQIRNEIEGFLKVKVGLINGQTIDYIDSNGNECGIIVATPQTIKNFPNIIKSAKMILFDEVHNLPAKSIRTIAFMAENAYYRCGCSGSPWRDDHTGLIIDAAIAPLNSNNWVSATELINKNVLTPVTITYFKCHWGTEWLGSFAKTYETNIIYNPERNHKIVELAKFHIERNEATLILFKNIKHGKILLNMISNAVNNEVFDIEYNGVHYDIHTVELVCGEDDLDRREAIFKAIKLGKCKCMIGSTIADEGLSISILQVLILAGSGKSTTRLFQRYGRVIRKYEGKDMAYIYDFVDVNETMYKHFRVRYELTKLEPAFKYQFLDIKDELTNVNVNIA